MTPDEIASVLASYIALSPRLDELVERFYGLLFTRYPEVRLKFRNDMESQKYHLSAALAIVFRNLDNFSELEGLLMSLGAGHVGFGVLPEHYPIVRDILLEAIHQTAGDAWSTQLEQAWREALNKVCATMLKGTAAAAMGVAQQMAPRG